MKVAVVGGKLQGVEACYLAREAGWQSLLIDKSPEVPATGICAAFVCCDILEEPGKFGRIIQGVDLIVPALEDPAALDGLVRLSRENGVPLAFDPNAYAVTSSKRKSDALFGHLGLAAPRSWPASPLPLIAKPSASSGSRGVRKIEAAESLDHFLRESAAGQEEWVLQEYLEGPSYSLEVMGWKGRCITVQATELKMDAGHDCQRVIAPAGLAASLDHEFREIASTLAAALSLTGVMDLEVILHQGRLKLLEIDARLPSQTPTAVLKSTGVNMLKLLAEVFVGSTLPARPPATRERGVVYEHIRVGEKGLQVAGEHIMAQAGPLHVEEDYWGADAAITNFSSRSRPWVATLINTGEDREAAWRKRRAVIEAISREFKLYAKAPSLREESIP